MSSRRGAGRMTGLVAVSVLVAGQAAAGQTIAAKVERKGDEIVAAGQFFHTTAPVVTWMEPGGYDAYRVERRFAPMDRASFAESTEDVKALRSPNRFGMRTRGLSPAVIERARGGGWDLETLRTVVDQFVIHYDVAGTSKRCFQVLHDARGLSVHFLLDLDGTIYQTLDLKEAAWHATVANGRSIGIEIANIGAYPVTGRDPLADWYRTGDDGRARITVPGGSHQRDPSAELRPSRDQPAVGEIQGQTLRQYDLTPRQYDSLVKLTATLCTLFPAITCDYPRDPSGKLITRKLSDDALKGYHGLLGHYHVQADKVDPGPAFQWDKVVDGARALMGR